MSWVEIDTDLRYLQLADSEPEPLLPTIRHWPPVSNLFERRLAANVRNRSRLRLDTAVFVRVVGLAAQLHNSTITLDVEVRGGQVEAQVVAVTRYLMPPITADVAGALAFALRWFADRDEAFCLSISPEHIFWIPLRD